MAAPRPHASTRSAKALYAIAPPTTIGATAAAAGPAALSRGHI